MGSETEIDEISGIAVAANNDIVAVGSTAGMLDDSSGNDQNDGSS